MPTHPLQSPLAGTLPPHLAERVWALNDRPLDEAGEFVLCWLHHAIRDHDNPALDAAIELANRAHKPVLVYQGLGGNHRFNSDRHHAFILQGARDLAGGLAERGIPYAFHLPVDPASPSPIRGLIARAAAVVTEDFPAPPFPAWSAAHAERAPCAFLAIDAACLMPLRLLGTRFDRAFKFREKAKDEWRARISEPWTDVAYEGPSAIASLDLDGSSRVDPAILSDADIADLCERCRIDHSVPPLTRKGGCTAGYARWDVFVRHHLGRYDKRRNDATNINAVSCLSPYLHHGHVSPFRIARETKAFGGPGADKFLDELLVWRELAYNFCAHTDPRVLETLAVLPGWARATLAGHSGDERDAIYHWESLARARTGDDLWDWAQKSLLRNGELHNNIRMTWGKMIPQWKPTPEKALGDLIDLNHRFALDGNNPNSYGGLLWCLGQFDRPFPDDNPVTGTIRVRTTAIHAERLQIDRYAESVRSRTGFGPLRVAVIGGGISGLACARAVQDQGCAVRVFDKGRAVGGRMSARSDGDRSFDHGAPGFGVTDDRFARYVRSWIEAGVCGVWRPTVGVIEDGAVRTLDDSRALAVGTPDMSGVCAHLATDLEVVGSTSVIALRREGDAWSLDIEPYKQEARTESGFDAVVVAAAATQCGRLLGEHSVSIRASLERIESRPQWVLMAELDGGEMLPDIFRLEGDPAIEKIVRESSKPGRPAGSGYVVHAESAWSRARYDADRDAVATELSSEFARVLASVGIAAEPTAVRAHRWGLARASSLDDAQCVFDAARMLVACGEGFRAAVGSDQALLEDGVQNAFLSGVAAAGRVLSCRSIAERAATGHEQASLF